MTLIIAQIIGIVAIIISSLAPQNKTKKKVLIFKLSSTILYALQYLILGAFSAAITNIIGTVRDYIFYRYANEDKEIPRLILYIFVFIVIVSGLFTFDDIISAIPIILSILTTYSIWQDSLKKYRGITVIITILWLIYNLSVGAYVSAIGSIVSLISAIIAIIRLDMKIN